MALAIGRDIYLVGNQGEPESEATRGHVAAFILVPRYTPHGRRFSLAS